MLDAKTEREYENSILRDYPESSLNLFWQVVYQEGIRNHHFLFKSEDVNLFLQSDRQKIYELIRDGGEDLIDIVSILIGLGTYSDIKNVLSSLTATLLEGVFHLYLRFLKEHKQLVGINLN